MDELLDLVNNNDEVIGTIYRSEAYRKNIHTIRVVFAFVINDQNELWIPRRSPNKTLFPSCLDASVAGHVTSGESYYEGFVRETEEELGLDVAHFKHKEIGSLSPYIHTIFGFTKLYLIYANNVSNYNRDDFSSAEWIKPELLYKKLQEGEKAKDDLIHIVSFLLQSNVLSQNT